MEINILLFAYLKEVAGKPVISITLPEPATAGSLLTRISEIYPNVADQVEYFRVSVDGEYVTTDTAISEKNEIAIIPPVSGG